MYIHCSRLAMLSNGIPELTKITAVGCSLSAVTAAFLAIDEVMFVCNVVHLYISVFVHLYIFTCVYTHTKIRAVGCSLSAVTAAFLAIDEVMYVCNDVYIYASMHIHRACTLQQP